MRTTGTCGRAWRCCNKNVSDAETVLLQHNQTREAIEMHRMLRNYDEAISVAESRGDPGGVRCARATTSSCSTRARRSSRRASRRRRATTSRRSTCTSRAGCRGSRRT